MKKLLILMVLFILSYAAGAQAFTDSNLPIVLITTDKDPSTGKRLSILDEPKVLANMKIIYRPDGTRNYLTDQNNADYLNYNGRIGIEFRGSSSQALPKKPYGLTTLEADNVSNNNVSIFDMPKENDWVLNSIAYDPSLVRNFLSYELSGNMGDYSTREKYCEVIINGDYKGLYIFMEKLKIDEGRINIVKMDTNDNMPPNITGGYVIKCDKTTGGDPVAWSLAGASFINDSPKPEDVTAQQNAYIYNQFLSLRNTTAAQNSSISNGYPSIIDIPSFVDFMIMNELASNVDGYEYSTYFHKDRNGKLRAGPIWDFDLTYGNDLFFAGYDRSHTDVWQFNNGDNEGAAFWEKLFNNSTFKCYLTKRWIELTAEDQPLNYTVISNRIDQLDGLLSEAAVREQNRWGTISQHANNISSLKKWLQTRTDWLNSKLNDCQACSNISLPALVISKINYNPLCSDTAVCDSLEFIEITNNSTKNVNLTGFYFSELGITYQFPVNSTIGANQKLFLASDASFFEAYYGIIPFGQFTRNLSNKSQRLVLADAFGNVIDQVDYSDSSPWPKEADGDGYYLDLIDLNSDNNEASNWKTSDIAVGFNSILSENRVIIFPVPAQTIITIGGTGVPIESYEITDLMGHTVKFENNVSSNTIHIEQLAPAIYLLKVHFNNGSSVVKKIIKK